MIATHFLPLASAIFLRVAALVARRMIGTSTGALSEHSRASGVPGRLAMKSAGQPASSASLSVTDDVSSLMFCSMVDDSAKAFASSRESSARSASVARAAPALRNLASVTATKRSSS